MSEIVGTIGKYGLLATIAAFVPAFVHGAMAGAVGISDNAAIATIQVIAYMAIVAYWARHNVVDGIMAGIGIGSGVFIGGLVHDLAIEGLRSTVSIFYNMLPDYILRGFLLGVATGFITGISPTAILGSILGFIMGALIMLLIRVGGLLADALDLAVSGLAKGINMGYLAILAPYLGSLMIGIPLSIGLLVIGFALAFGIGFAIGVGLAAMLLGVFFAWSIVSLILYLGLLSAGLIIFKTFTRSRDIVEIMLDLIAVLLFKFIAPALYSAGYAALTTRRKSTGLYLIGLGALVS